MNVCASHKSSRRTVARQTFGHTASGGFGGGAAASPFPNRGAVATNTACSRARSLRDRLPPAVQSASF